MNSPKCALVGALVLTSLCPAQSVLVSFDFDNDTTTPTTGASVASLSWNSGGSEGYTSTFTGQGRALSIGDFEIGEYFQLNFDASQYESIRLNGFRTNGTESAPLDWSVTYSLTGANGSFTTGTSYTMSKYTGSTETTFTGFALPEAANNQSSIVFRFVATSSTRIDLGTGAASGTVHLDNLELTGTTSAVPEPSTYALSAGIVVLGFSVGRQRRRRRQRNTAALAA